MKKLLILAVIAGLTYFSADAQVFPGHSAYGHHHNKMKKAKKYHHISAPADADRRDVNEKHKIAIRTAKENEELTRYQQKDMVKQANVTHKVEMHSVTQSRKTGKH